MQLLIYTVGEEYLEVVFKWASMYYLLQGCPRVT
jgi:hypothetical protein